MFETLQYRLGVGIMLINTDKKVFIGKRINNISIQYPWQMPQGGIETNENHIIAAKRELAEETGLTNVKLLSITDDWLSYDLPEEYIPNFWEGKYKGQRQKWLLMQFTGVDNEVNLQHSSTPEFCEWKWENLDDLVKLIVPFKRKLYLEIIYSFKPIIDKL